MQQFLTVGALELTLNLSLITLEKAEAAQSQTKIESRRSKPKILLKPNTHNHKKSTSNKYLKYLYRFQTKSETF